MDDDLKKTILQPHFANRMSYHTVVMERPPVMMAERPVPANAAVTGLGDARLSSIATLRTRMLSAQGSPDFHNERPMRPPFPTHVPPRLAPLPPLQRRGTWNAPAVVPRAKRGEVIRKAVIVGGAAIMLGVCLVLPFSGAKNNSESSLIPAAPAAAQVEAESGDRESANPDETAAVPLPPATSPQTPLTEEKAGSLLLAGCRQEALAAYRQLANSPASTPGIQAMVEVLAQKVDGR